MNPAIGQWETTEKLPQNFGKKNLQMKLLETKPEITLA